MARSNRDIEVNININIGQLILNGISVQPHERPLLKASLESELGRLLSQYGMSPNMKNACCFRTMRADSFDTAENSTPYLIGHQIARALYGGMK